MSQDHFLEALPADHRLHWYVLERVLGQGGFGITYLARDTNLAQAVAIKEYLPVDVALRGPDDVVAPRTDAHRERYRWGLERFIEEARTLARFDHPNIVRVLSVFEANGTAYMVMRFEEGENLATLLDSRGVLPEPELLRTVLPILDGLQVIHRAGFIHRDIKPENIHVRRDGTPVLLDFGSARQSIGTSRTMTVLIAPGYAPLEQYYGEAGAQGPWTDLYGLGATCYRAIAGEPPRDAIARTKGVLGSSRETMTPAVTVGRGRYSPQLLAAVDHALQLNEGDRPQTVAAWRRELQGPDAEVSHEGARPAAAMASTMSTRPMRRVVPFAIAIAIVFALVAFVAWRWIGRSPAPPPSVRIASPASTVAPPMAQAVSMAPAEVAHTATISPPSTVAASGTASAEIVSPPSEKREAVAKTTPTTKTPSLPAAPSTEPVPTAAKPPRRPRTAEGGDPGAQLALGIAKEEGRGMAKSLFEAYVWYSLAAKQGQPGAETMKQRVAARMQDAEIRQAEELVARWRPSPEPTSGEEPPQ